MDTSFQKNKNRVKNDIFQNKNYRLKQIDFIFLFLPTFVYKDFGIKCHAFRQFGGVAVKDYSKLYFENIIISSDIVVNVVHI